MDGIIVVNKPKGCTSHDIVYQVKKIYQEKVGHTGTLDPLATGVLPLLIGKGTLVSKYLINHDKTYEVELQLGKKTDTADAEGEVIEEQEVDSSLLEEANINKVVHSFLGKQSQIPPMYSAIKVNGKKLYEYARKGETVTVKPREIEIYEITLLSCNQAAKQITFRVSCSKGTYIRSLCEDIAKKLRTIGYMSGLNRTKVGIFALQDAIEIEELIAKKEDEAYLEKQLLSIEAQFQHEKEIRLDDKRFPLFLNGVKLTYVLEDGIYRIYHKDTFIGIGIIKNQLLKRDIVI